MVRSKEWTARPEGQVLVLYRDLIVDFNVQLNAANQYVS
jgi:hypothetical protein